MKHWKPIMIENSRIPVWLSKISPIEIGAITLGVIVLSRGQMDERVRRHETIHFQQYLELLFIGFLIIYLYDFIRNYIRFRSGEIAYMMLRAEREAYAHDDDPDYLANRVRWAWLKPKPTMPIT